MVEKDDTTTGIIALILGILGCLQIIPLVGSIVAIVMGYMSRGTAGESNGRWGLILGWIMIVIYILGIIGTIIFFILVAVGAIAGFGVPY